MAIIVKLNLNRSDLYIINQIWPSKCISGGGDSSPAPPPPPLTHSFDGYFGEIAVPQISSHRSRRRRPRRRRRQARSSYFFFISSFTRLHSPHSLVGCRAVTCIMRLQIFRCAPPARRRRLQLSRVSVPCPITAALSPHIERTGRGN